MKGREETTPVKGDTATFENAADAQAMEQVTAARAAGEDPFGDFDNDSGGEAAAPAASPAPAPDATTAAELDPPEPTAAPAAAPTPPAPPPPPAAAPAPAPVPVEAAAPPPPAPLQFKTRPATEIQAEQTALLDKKAKAFTEYSEGTMTPEAYAALDAEVMQGMMRIGSEMTLAQASAQSALQTSEQALALLKVTAKTEGQIDYDADPRAAKQFDAQVQALATDPDMAKLSDAEFFEKAHGMVLALRGISRTAAAPPPPASTPPPARADMKPSITLRDIPAAATPHTGGGVLEQLSRLSGLEFQDAVGAMPKGQRDAWLDS